jgi:hypothetical protein
MMLDFHYNPCLPMTRNLVTQGLILLFLKLKANPLVYHSQ